MPSVSDFSPMVATVTAAIGSGATISGTIDLGGGALCGIITPSSFTSTILTISGAVASGGAAVGLYNSGGTAITGTVAASRWTVLSPSDFAAVPFIQLTTSAAETGARVATLLVRPV